MQGKIIENISNLYKVEVNKEIYEATARGKFKKDEISPVVGDNVEIQVINDQEKKAVINKIEERDVYIKRPKLANISQIVLVLSSKHPKPDLLMLDKQLAFAELMGIKAIIVLNKIDLDKDKSFGMIKEIYQDIGYTVIETEAKNKKGIEKLNEYLKDNINAFSGNSGVGKSTLINAIFNNEMTQEGEISKRNRRGKNTTTATKLYEIDNNTYIADTPGFSTFDISEIASKDLYKYFREFKEYEKQCEFVGCTHIKEENCGIKKALKDGKIKKNCLKKFVKNLPLIKRIHPMRSIWSAKSAKPLHLPETTS